MKNTTCYDSSLVSLCKEHLDELALSMRLADRRELWAMYRLPVRSGLELCQKQSVRAVTFLYKGQVIACCGVAPVSLLGNAACIWSFSTHWANHCPKSFWQASCVVRNYFLSLYPHLYAVCDVRYQQVRRYLLHLGAEPSGESINLAGPETRFQIYRFLTREGQKSIKKEKIWAEFY